MPKRRRERAPKPKHEVRYTDERKPYCWACHSTQGEYPWPCRSKYSELSPFEQKQFYEKTGVCGQCGQWANRERSFCKCRDCGCFTLHMPTPPEQHETLFDMEEVQRPTEWGRPLQ